MHLNVYIYIYNIRIYIERCIYTKVNCGSHTGRTLACMCGSPQCPGPEPAVRGPRGSAPPGIAERELAPRGPATRHGRRRMHRLVIRSRWARGHARAPAGDPAQADAAAGEPERPAPARRRAGLQAPAAAPAGGPSPQAQAAAPAGGPPPVPSRERASRPAAHERQQTPCAVLT